MLCTHLIWPQKNICEPKYSQANETAFVECNWISDVADDVIFVKNFIVNHSMRFLTTSLNQSHSTKVVSLD